MAMQEWMIFAKRRSEGMSTEISTEISYVKKSEVVALSPEGDGCRVSLSNGENISLGTPVNDVFKALNALP